ncbi:MAG TPA: hypothetical protein VHA82_17475 [Ramlibacter sp.]|nr:hypothetical protein [Ramlibacter sp.]
MREALSAIFFVRGWLAPLRAVVTRAPQPEQKREAPVRDDAWMQLWRQG